MLIWTHVHVFSCTGYNDLIVGGIMFDMFFRMDVSMEKLGKGARQMRLVIEDVARG